MIPSAMLLHGWREPALPRPAATLLLLREQAAGLEVLMTRRSAAASFAPGVYVFPGGTLDAEDDSPCAQQVLRARPDQDDTDRIYATAALREAFEELGILLASPRGSGKAVEPSQAAGLSRHPDGCFLERIESAGLELRVDQTAWFSRWITDRDLPRRFDVRFLVASMPPGQVPRADEQEQFEPVWVRPQEALAGHESGTFPLIFPTIRTLRQLARFDSVSAVFEHCRTQTAVYTSCPRGGWLKGRDVRFCEDEPAYGELTFVAPDGQMVHHLDWQSETLVPLRRNIARLTAPNPSMMTGPGTNTYIVGDEQGRIVIDPGPALEAHIERLAAAVGDSLTAIVCTHSHADHSPGAAMLRARLGRDLPILGLPSGPHARPNARFVPDRAVTDGEVIRAGANRLRVLHTPGHAANHLCLVLEEDRVLFSGDHVLNGSTTVVDPPDGDMAQYLASLERLAREPVDFILPAHGYVLAPAVAAMKALVAHRLAREGKVLAALQTAGSATLAALVPRVYGDVPESLYPVASRSLLAHLLKLRQDGRARQEGESWRSA